MRCARASVLILSQHDKALLVANDRERLAAHLRVCEKCSALAAQYADVEPLLHLYEPPDFAADFYQVINANVRREIRKNPRRAHQAAFAIMRLRLAIGGAITVLLLLIGAGFYLHANRSDKTIATNTEVVNNSYAQIIRDEESERSQEQTKTASTPNRQAHTRPAKLKISTSRSAKFLTNKSKPETESNVLTAKTEMLRMELQTSDPNVRIIWFAPSPKIGER